MKLTNKQYDYIQFLRKIRAYWEDAEKDTNLTKIQASYLIKKLLIMNI